MVDHRRSIGNVDVLESHQSPSPMVFCAEDRIEALLGLPPMRGWCNAGRTAHLESVQNPRQQRLTRFSCGAWFCRVCSARKRMSAGQHYAMQLLLADGVLFERSYQPHEWDAIRQAFVRSKRGPVSWVKIGSADQPGVIIGCSPAPEGWTVFTDREAAVVRLGELLRNMMPVRTGKHCKPISCSRDWTPPKKPKRYRLLRWVRVSEPEPILRALDAVGIQGKARQHNSSGVWDVTFEVPDGWNEAQRDALVSQICCIKKIED